MIKLTPKTRIFLAAHSADFRLGIDGLAAICLKELNHSPRNGAMFIFRNKSGTAIKILFFDGTGFWICMKRLSKGKFEWPKTHGKTSIHMNSRQLSILISGRTQYQIPDSQWKKAG